MAQPLCTIRYSNLVIWDPCQPLKHKHKKCLMARIHLHVEVATLQEALRLSCYLSKTLSLPFYKHTQRYDHGNLNENVLND